MSRRRRRASIVSGVTLPVTPMLDMTFQLLFFLVLTFRPSSVAEHAVRLVAVEGAGGSAPPSVGLDPGQDQASRLTIVVRSLPDGSGGISSLSVRTVEDGERPLADVAALSRFLQVRRQGLAQPDAVRVQADSRLKYAFVMDVLDACRRADFKQIGFAAPDF